MVDCTEVEFSYIPVLKHRLVDKAIVLKVAAIMFDKGDEGARMHHKTGR